MKLDRFLDVGAGAGTYVKRFRPALGGYWVACEVWAPYVSRFCLDELYDEVWVRDARTLNLTPGEFDVAICGDVLEHMTKPEAVTLVEKLVEVAMYVILSIPTCRFPQGSLRGNPYEVHVKDDWSHQEALDAFPVRWSRPGKVVGVFVASRFVE